MITYKENKTGIMPNILKVIKNIIISFIFTFIFLNILALLLTYTNISTKITKPAIILITLISILLTSFFVAKKGNAKGWSSGAVTGILYMLIIYIAGYIVFKNKDMGSTFFMMTALAVLSGTVGGILGVNAK